MKSINVEVGLIRGLSAEEYAAESSPLPGVHHADVNYVAKPRWCSMRDNSVSRMYASASPNAAITAVASRRKHVCAPASLASLPTPAGCTAIRGAPARPGARDGA